MQVSAAQIFKELEQGKWKPFYLIVGEEPFQSGELIARIKAFFVKDGAAGEFNYEAFDGEHLDAGALLSSLDTLPGLFDDPQNGARLIYCSRIEKAASLETLDGYFQNPSPTTCFLMTAAKVDKRKSWVKHVEAKGYSTEVAEPYDREWPRWQGYFEKKVKKKIDTEAWELLVESSGRMLSVLWAETEKAATYVGDRTLISKKDVSELAALGGDTDVFAFAEEVLCRRAAPSLRRFHHLLRGGENEIKLLSILVRQFRLVDQCARLMRAGITDSKTISTQIGSHPFFVPKIMGQAKHQTKESLGHALDLLAEADFHLKTGEGGLFDRFLVPYFAAARK